MSGCGGMADALSSGGSVFDVWVQVPSTAPAWLGYGQVVKASDSDSETESSTLSSPAKQMKPQVILWFLVYL